MQYRLLKVLFYLFSLLPWRLIYAISSISAFLIQYVFGYRKTVLNQNLKIAFPSLSEKDTAVLKRKFYQHFCDIWFETLKIPSLDKEIFKNKSVLPEDNLLKEYTSKGRSVFIVMGHTGNWELMDAFLNDEVAGQLQGLYQPVKNPTLNKIVQEFRTKFGSKAIERKKSIRTLLQQKHSETNATIFLTDQTPYELPKASWTQFFDVETPFFNGFAQLAQRLNMPILYLHVFKLKRGKYSLHFELLSDEPAKDGTEVLIQKFANKLEQNIKKQPFNWLWTHRRWKRARFNSDNNQLSK